MQPEYRVLVRRTNADVPVVAVGQTDSGEQAHCLPSFVCLRHDNRRIQKLQFVRQVLLTIAEKDSRRFAIAFPIRAALCSIHSGGIGTSIVNGQIRLEAAEHNQGEFIRLVPMLTFVPAGRRILLFAGSHSFGRPVFRILAGLTRIEREKEYSWQNTELVLTPDKTGLWASKPLARGCAASFLPIAAEVQRVNSVSPIELVE